MFLLSLFLLPRCDAEGGLHQLHSCAGEPHTRLVVCTNQVYACQFISAPTPSKLEKPPADFQGCLSILFNSTTIWGNNVTMLLCLHFRQHQSGRFERMEILHLKKKSLEAWKLLVIKREQFRWAGRFEGEWGWVCRCVKGHLAFSKLYSAYWLGTRHW